VVLDELPWLAEQDTLFDGALQTAWDRLLSPRPVLLLLLGSDLHMMARLTAYDQPFYGRADNLVLGPLNPAETGDALGLSGADAIDAHLVSGGLPGILRAWPHAMPTAAFLEQECADPASALFSVPGHRCWPNSPSRTRPAAVSRPSARESAPTRTSPPRPADAKAPFPQAASPPLLHRLTEEKHVLEIDHPLSTQPGKPALYRIADPSLRFYLAAGRHAEEQVRRGRSRCRLPAHPSAAGTPTAAKPSNPSCAKHSNSPAPRANCPGRMQQPSAAGGTGASTRRSTSIGADRSPTARHIYFTGSIKWLTTPFDRHDLATHHAACTQLPGYQHASTGTAIVSLSGRSGTSAEFPDSPFPDSRTRTEPAGGHKPIQAATVAALPGLGRAVGCRTTSRSSASDAAVAGAGTSGRNRRGRSRCLCGSAGGRFACGRNGRAAVAG
jgi:hypothetical protein